MEKCHFLRTTNSLAEWRSFLHQPLFLDVNSCFKISPLCILLKSNAFHIRYPNSQIFALTQNSEVSENYDTDITVSTTNRSLVSPIPSFILEQPSLTHLQGLPWFCLPKGYTSFQAKVGEKKRRAVCSHSLLNQTPRAGSCTDFWARCSGLFPLNPILVEESL